MVLLCLLHGASFLALKTAGEVRRRSLRAGRRIAPVAAVAVLGFVVWTQVMAGDGVAPLLVEASPSSPPSPPPCSSAGPGRRAFAATSVAMAAVVVSIFVNLYPRVMVSTLGPSADLTVDQHRVVAVRAEGDDGRRGGPVPGRAAYQAWTYYMFRRRIA